MARAVVILTMIVLPLCSILVEHWMRPAAPLVALAGTWFVFWAVGARLVLAGFTQLFRPAQTAGIFKLQSEEAFPLIRELGIANFSSGALGLASIAVPTFVLPVAIWSAIFYGAAGVAHVARRERSSYETFAMVTDLFAFAVLLAIVVTLFMGITI